MDNDKEKTYISTNLKYLRNINKKSLSDIANICNKTDVAIHYWENGSREPNAVDIARLSNYFNITVDDLLLKDLRFDNAELIDITSDIIKIPVYGTIKAGIPIESQPDVIDYVEIPKNWTRGGKKFYGLQLSGDSMFPKYNDKDIVIFEQNNDVQSYNGKDVAVMINGTESTFKKISVNEQGIVLQPYNLAYDIMMFSKEQVEQLPIKVVGIAREKRTKID